MALGIDIHPVYQEHINWGVLDRNVKFIWLKVSDGGGAYRKIVDGRIYTPDAHAAGMKMTGAACGGYHYAQFSPSPEAQADILTQEVRRLGLTSLAPALDLEAPFTPNALAKDFAFRFIARLKSHGWDKVAIYSYTTMAQYLRPDKWGIPGLITWIARPGPVGQLGVYTGRTDVHQFNSAARITGILENVDANETLNSNLLEGFGSGDELDMTPLEVQNAVYAAVTNLAIDAASGNDAAKMAQAWRASMRAVLSIDQLTDDETAIIQAVREQGSPSITPEQLQELKDAIKEAQTDEQADAVVDAFYRRLAPTS